MQAARILPLLTAVLAAAYSLFAADWPSGMAAIAALPILAVVQAIIFADAGESASTENIAAVINNLILDLIGNNPALCRTHARASCPDRVPGKRHFRCCKATCRPSLKRTVAPAQSSQGFGLAPMLPVAISGSQLALPRPCASHL